MSQLIAFRGHVNLLRLEVLCTKQQHVVSRRSTCALVVSSRTFASTRAPREDSTEETKASKLSGANSSTMKAYMDLSKARLSSLVVATTAAGFVAGGGPFSTATLGAACVGTALCSSSASAWNQIFEMERDALMKRTRHRPLVNGALSKKHATAAAATWGVGGAAVLALGTDATTTLLGIGNIALYSGLYTYMKPRSIYNTWVGAVVGAIPPVMGWTASGGSILDIEALLLGGTLYLWQMPHFFALSYMHRVDYKRGGFQMVPVLEEHGDGTAKLVTRYTWYLSAIPFISTAADVTSSMFAMEGLVLNTYALHVAYKFKDERTNANARKVFLTSLWYLPSLLMLFLLHSKTWDDKEKDKANDRWRQYISSYIHAIRDQGKQWCVHEAVILKDDDHSKACPVAFGKEKSSDSKDAVTEVVEKATSFEETHKQKS